MLGPAVRVTFLVCEAPPWSTHVTATLAPGLWAWSASPSVVDESTEVPPTAVITDNRVMPACSAGEPPCTPPTSGPDVALMPTSAARARVRSRIQTPLYPTSP